MRPVYLDCNATTPLDPEVRDLMFHFFSTEFGNEGSRTHEFGTKAKQAVQKARDQVAEVVGAKRDEVIFTSGATESNNLAILGLREAGHKTGKKHIITTAIEHKAVLEPFEKLEREGFKVTRLPVGKSGYVEPELVREALQPDTFLVSVMQANNETGVRQPLDGIVEILNNHQAFFHTDAAQGFGKDLETLKNSRIDLISISGHKIFAPKGIGALIIRRRDYERPPLEPLVYGGGQERGFRSGTLPVALIAALGKAAEISLRDQNKRRQICRDIRQKAIDAFTPVGAQFVGDQDFVMDHVLNLSIPNLDSEALIVALKDLIAISNGSACTSTKYEPSYVLKEMGMTDDEANSCVRISWCHLTPEVNWDSIKERISNLI